jgi:hypothetical protein
VGWEVNDNEFDSVLRLTATRRYRYFITRVAGHGLLWGLYAPGGWVVAEDDQGDKYFPVWPHQRFAQAVATGRWTDGSPMTIDIDDWVEEWLPDLDRDEIDVAVFQTPDNEGIAVSPARLKHDLEVVEQFNL